MLTHRTSRLKVSASVAHFILYVSKLSPEMQSDLPKGQRVSLRAQDWTWTVRTWLPFRPHSN